MGYTINRLDKFFIFDCALRSLRKTVYGRVLAGAARGWLFTS